MMCHIGAGHEACRGAATHDDCIAVHQLLKDDLRAAAEAEQWRQRCAERFAWSQLVEPSLMQHTWLATTSAHPIDAAARVVERLLVELAPGAAQHGAQVPPARR